MGSSGSTPPALSAGQTVNPGTHLHPFVAEQGAGLTPFVNQPTPQPGVIPRLPQRPLTNTFGGSKTQSRSRFALVYFGVVVAESWPV
jgi:hypothetical protein